MKKKILYLTYSVIICLSIIFGMSSYSNAESSNGTTESSKELKDTFSTTLRDSVKKSTYNDLMALVGENNLDSTYKITGLTLKDQKKTSLCWAFSLSTVLEGTGSGKIYSPAFFDYKATQMYNRQQGTSGSILMALATITSGNAPVLDSKFPFSSVYDETNNTSSTYYLTPISSVNDDLLNQSIDARVDDSNIFASVYKDIDSSGNITYSNSTGTSYSKDADNSGIPDEVEAIRTLIKKHIKNNGPVESLIYMDDVKSLDSNNAISETKNGYYNSKTYAYYCNDSTKTVNHAITIIGWDDNFETTNFTDGQQPKNKGAYIVQNSYGTYLGDKNGYMYISYDDVDIEKTVLGIDKIEEFSSSSDIPYNNLYQHDELGANLEIGFGSSNASAMAADVYTRKDTTKSEYLNEIGINLLSTEGIQVYVNPDSDDKSNLKLVATELDNITPGYHVIKLNEPIELTGDKFVVAVKYTNSESGAKVPIEANKYDSGISTTQKVYNTATANVGESFTSSDNGNTWDDLSVNYKIGSNTLKNTSTCIKAYTVQSTSQSTWKFVTGVALDKTSLNMKTGDTENLTATITPTDATNQNITWTSSNESIATVSSNGVITAVSTGTATITVKTEEGGYTASCTVNVSANTSENTNNTNSTSNTNNTNSTSNTNNTNSTSNTNNTNNTDNTNNLDNTNNTNNTNSTDDINKTKISVIKVTLSKTEINLNKGKSEKITAVITPTNATNQKVAWSSSNESIATVSSNGVITAVSEGTALITVRTLDGNYVATCKITVVSGEDDIYSENNSINNSNSSSSSLSSNHSSSNSSTSANVNSSNSSIKSLPYTGAKTFLIIIAFVFAIVAGVTYIRYKNISKYVK